MKAWTFVFTTLWSNKTWSVVSNRSLGVGGMVTYDSSVMGEFEHPLLVTWYNPHLGSESLKLVAFWTCGILKIHQWRSQERVHSTFQISNSWHNFVYQEKWWFIVNMCWFLWIELVYYQEPIPLAFDLKTIKLIESHKNIHQDWFGWII